MGFEALGGVLRKGCTGALVFAALVPASAKAIQVDTAEAPDNNLSLTVSAIQGAQSSILLNIYELDAPEITDALLAQIKNGLTVRILEEGQPVGGMTAAAKGAQYQLQEAMEAAVKAGASDDALFEMTSKAGGKRRYRYDHAKYAVIDGDELLVGSENYSPTGNPEPGSIGNRGWEAVIHDSSVAQQFTAIFGGDAVTTYNDVIALVGGSGETDSLASLFGEDSASLADFTQRRPKPVASHRPPAPATPEPRPTEHRPTKPKPEPMPDPVATSSGTGTFDASSVQPITSPNTSLDGLLGAINNAQTSIDIEQMTFNSAWTSTTPTSLVLSAVIAAARRGVRVRVLLNDESVFGGDENTSKPINVPTAQTLNQTASSGGLQMEARIANIKAMGVDYIHNKGMLIDGTETLISSINWDENSIMNNREAAVLVTSPDVYNYYEALFTSDWNNSSGSSAESASGADVMTAERSPSGNLECPSSISVRVDFGQVGQSDPDFAVLSGKSVTGAYAEVSSGEDCLYSDSSGGSSDSDRYVEVSAATDGGFSLLLEGYTPKSDKIYSVRAKISRLSGTDSGLAASVYDGSGTHQRIGTATVAVSF